MDGFLNLNHLKLLDFFYHLLKKKGHIIKVIEGDNRNIFGRGQVIKYNPKLKTYSAGSDPRADGLAIPRI